MTRNVLVAFILKILNWIVAPHFILLIVNHRRPSIMSQNISDTAYIQTDPNCIGDHAIKARGKIFKRIAEIAKDMGTIAKTASHDETQSPRKLKAGEWYQNVISIFGERGSGKTILLLSTCACLGKGKDSKLPPDHNEDDWPEHEKIRQEVDHDILLPIIQPEYFGSEDTLITWILTYLKEYVENAMKNDKNRFKTMKIKQDDDEIDDDMCPVEFIEQMQKNEFLFSRKFSSNLAEQDVTADDFQMETLKVVEAHAHFLWQWRKLVDELIGTSGKQKTETDRNRHPFLIIPIDDADLNPATLPIILLQMQILQRPNVLFLFSVHRKSLDSMMYISQLELNTNRVDTRPVVNFGNLIDHKLRDVEDVRADALSKIDKYLPRKFRVEIEPLSPKERLNFKPLIKGKNGDTFTFLQLLEEIPLKIFDHKRLKNISQFFDLAQSFKERCPLDKTGTSKSRKESFCKVCTLRQDKKMQHCWSPTLFEYDEAVKSNDTKKIEILIKECDRVSHLIPSIYANALPKYPRAMEQVYQILRRRVEDTEFVEEKRKYGELRNELKDKDDESKKRKCKDIEKKLREKTSQTVKALLTACLGYVPLLPRAFVHRIKFIDNPNLESKHPIQIDFETDNLTNNINVDGEGIEIDASTSGKSTRILSVHPISDYFMQIPGRIKDNNSPEEIPYTIPNEWEYCKTVLDKVAKRETKFYRVPNGYFAVYNLAYDLTTSNGVFGRTINSNQYPMRDGSPVGIFSVQARTSTLFTDCYCAMPRWYRFADYNLFELAWNDLVRHIEEIMRELSSVPKEHLLSDWVVLSLLRIHICLVMNYSPFMVTEDEKNAVLTKLRDKPSDTWNDDEEPIKSIKHFVKEGLRSVTEYIKSEWENHALSKHLQAFKVWAEYGLPMLSNGDYVSEKLGRWIVYQWMMLLITNDDHDQPCPDCFNKCKSSAVTAIWSKYTIPVQWNTELPKIGEEESPKTEGLDHHPISDCESCAIARLALIFVMLDETLNEKQKKTIQKSMHPSLYFLREFFPEQTQEFHKMGDATRALKNQLSVMLDLWQSCGQSKPVVKKQKEKIKCIKQEWKGEFEIGKLKHTWESVVKDYVEKEKLILGEFLSIS